MPRCLAESGVVRNRSGIGLSFPGEGGYEGAAAAAVTEFAEVDALPGAEEEAAVGDGDGEGRAYQGGLCVGRHVVGAFESVGVVGFAFLYEAVEDGGQVDTHVGVGVLVDGERRGGMAYEEVEQTGARESGKRTEHFIGDEMASPGTGTQVEFGLLPHNGAKVMIK